MKNFEITEKNKYIYKEFYDIKKGKVVNDKANGIPMIVALLGGYLLGCILLPINDIISSFDLPKIVTLIPNVLGSVGYIIGYITVSSRLMLSISTKEFQKKYPNFDINIDINKLANALEKSNLLSMTTKETKSKTDLYSVGQKVEKVTVDEKNSGLKQDINYYYDVKNQENLLNTNTDENTNEYQKKIGAIK